MAKLIKEYGYIIAIPVEVFPIKKHPLETKRCFLYKIGLFNQELFLFSNPN